MKISKLILLVLVFSGLTFQSCSHSGDIHIYEGYTGTLSWQGSPAADGNGLLLLTNNKTYGVPGIRDDYKHLFQNENEVDVLVDFILTGKTTVRGWGNTFKEISIVNIERLTITLEE